MSNKIKKIVSLLLLLSICSFSACGETILTAETGRNTEKDDFVKVVTPSKEAPRVLAPLTLAGLEAIPKVSPHMTTGEMRQIVLDFAELSMSFVWTPKADFRVEKQENDYLAGALYGGIPYDGYSGNPYKWMLYYDEATGVLDSARVPGGAQTLFSDCSSYAYSAWSRVANSMKWSVTPHITLSSGILKIGDYDWDPAIIDFKKESVFTTEICAQNGEQRMYRSYDKLLPADGVVNYLPVGGHVMIVKEVHTVKNAAGIDGDASFAIVYDQRNSTVEKKQSDGSTYTAQAGIGRKLSYRNLFEKGYLPFGVKELYGLEPVEKAEASLSASCSSVTPEELCRATITSNYPILTVHVTVRDENGAELYRADAHVSEHVMPYMEYPLSKRIFESTLGSYAGGGHTVSVQTRVSTGELLSAYEGLLI